jgi:hypothetical protein
VSPFRGPLVVPPESAAALCSGVSDKLFMDHFALVKPASTDEDPHALLNSSLSRCILPRVEAGRHDRSQTPEGTEANQWFVALRNALLESFDTSGDVAVVAKERLFRSSSPLADRYVAPRAGRSSFRPVDFDLADANSLSNELRDQIQGRIKSLSVEMVVPLGEFGQAIGHSDAFNLAKWLTMTAGMLPADWAVVTRVGDSAERMIFFISRTPAAGAPDSRLRGFSLATRPAGC